MAYNDDTPFTLVDIVRDILGDDAAKLVLEHCAGTQVDVPRNAYTAPKNPLVVALGAERAQLICAELARVRFYVPRDASATPRAKALKMLADTGLSASKIARASGMSERHVYKLNQVRRRKMREARERAAELLAAKGDPKP